MIDGNQLCNLKYMHFRNMLMAINVSRANDIIVLSSTLQRKSYVYKYDYKGQTQFVKAG